MLDAMAHMRSFAIFVGSKVIFIVVRMKRLPYHIEAVELMKDIQTRDKIVCTRDGGGFVGKLRCFG